jgi:hypothetical protein
VVRERLEVPCLPQKVVFREGHNAGRVPAQEEVAPELEWWNSGQ